MFLYKYIYIKIIRTTNMRMNLNDYDNEYEMFNEQTSEIIDMYGVPVTYIKSKNVNFDDIFGEYSHKKFDQVNVFKNIMVMPQNPEAYDVGMDFGNLFTKFGFLQGEVFHCFISKSTIERMGFTNFRIDGVGDIVMTPSGKKFEITYIAHEPAGANNKFVYENAKNVYMIKCKVWFYNADEKETVDTTNPNIEDKLEKFDFSKMDIIFNVDKNDDTIPEAEKVKPTRIVTQNTEAEKIKVKKPNIFGEWD